MESGPGVDLWVRFPKAAPPFGLVINHVTETGPWHAMRIGCGIDSGNDSKYP